MWYALSILAVVCLLLSWNTRNSVWGGMTALGIVALVAAVVRALLGHGFDWSIVGRGAVVGALVGAILELLARLSAKARQ